MNNFTGLFTGYIGKSLNIQPEWIFEAYMFLSNKE